MWDIELAEMFKARDNPNNIGPLIGKVVAEKPLKISILDGMVILQENQLYKCKHMQNHYYDSIKGTDLILNDEILLIPAEGEQIFFIIDKVQKVGD